MSSKLQGTRQQIYDVKRYGSSVRELPNNIQQLALKLGQGGIHVLLNLLNEEKTCCCGCSDKHISSRFELVESVSTVAYDTPSSSNMIIENIVFLEKSKLQNLVRIVAAPISYGEKEGRFNVTMVKSNDDVHKFVSSPDNYLPV